MVVENSKWSILKLCSKIKNLQINMTETKTGDFAQNNKTSATLTLEAQDSQ